MSLEEILEFLEIIVRLLSVRECSLVEFISYTVCLRVAFVYDDIILIDPVM